jgi:hypothetical protein
MTEMRCSDCLSEFEDGDRFAVIKEDKSRSYNDEERLLGAHLFQVLVCETCAGWYDDVARVPRLHESFPVIQCKEWQCRHVFPDRLCCLLPIGHVGEHSSKV